VPFVPGELKKLHPVDGIGLHAAVGDELRHPSGDHLGSNCWTPWIEFRLEHQRVGFAASEVVDRDQQAPERQVGLEANPRERTTGVDLTADNATRHRAPVAR
jgi:hypothetical protein